MFRAILETGGDFLTVTHDERSDKLVVRVDKAKMATHGRPALSQLLLKLHVYRCTADVIACRNFYKDLTDIGEVFLEWRRIMLKR